MTQLYSTLAEIYHEMYQHVFDYDAEFNFYDSILKTNNCHKILEVGCGSARTLHYLDLFLGNSHCFGLDLSTIALKLLLSISPERMEGTKIITGTKFIMN